MIRTCIKAITSVKSILVERCCMNIPNAVATTIGCVLGLIIGVGISVVLTAISMDSVAILLLLLLIG